MAVPPMMHLLQEAGHLSPHQRAQTHQAYHLTDYFAVSGTQFERLSRKLLDTHASRAFWMEGEFQCYAPSHPFTSLAQMRRQLGYLVHLYLCHIANRVLLEVLLTRPIRVCLFVFLSKMVFKDMLVYL